VTSIASHLCRSHDLNERLAGLEIIGAKVTELACRAYRIGPPFSIAFDDRTDDGLYPFERTFRRAALPIVRDVLQRETDPWGVVSAARELAELRLADAIGPLLEFADHPDGRVRNAVADGLKGFDDARALSGLTHLCRDQDRSVRETATASLARLVRVDSAEIRSALHARLHDPDDEIRMWALMGLAVRRDRDAVDAAARELSRIADDPYADGYHVDMVREVVTLIPDPRYVPALRRFLARRDWLGDHYDTEALVRLCEDPAAGPPDPYGLGYRGWSELG
jgi:HEAT repeat protein